MEMCCWLSSDHFALQTMLTNYAFVIMISKDTF